MATAIPDWRTNPYGQKAVDFISNLYLIGDYQSQKWKLTPGQEANIRQFYGTRRADGSRQYTRNDHWKPKGRGKTQFAAGYSVYQWACGKPGQEIYAASSDRDKAGRIYKAMAHAIRSDKRLLAMCKREPSDYFMRIEHRNGTIFQALASDSDQGHSLNPSMLVCDEVHLWERGRALYDALVNGLSKRALSRPILIHLSTAGTNKSPDSLPWQLYSYAKNVRDGLIKDPECLVWIEEVPMDEDWTSEEVWQKYIPCDYVNWDEIRKMCTLAKQIPSNEPGFRTLQLNQWIEHSEETWLPVSEFRACGSAYSEEDLYDEPCTAAFDLSCVRDLTSLALFFPRSKRVLSYSWLPGENLKRREQRDGVTYYAWSEERPQHFFLCPSSRIQYEQVGNQTNDILSRFNVTKLVADPYSLNQITPYLTIEPERYPQSPGYMSPPMKWLESAIADRLIEHNNNPVLTWCMKNVVAEKDKYENLSPHKGKSRKRIDAAVALIMAIGAWLGTEPQADLNAFCSDRSNLIF